jgi:branched-chain amino acid transport system substrate-binding protein
MIDAIYLGLGATDALNFLNQYEQAGGDTNLIGGSILADQSVLSARGQAKELLIGTPMSGSQADDWDDPDWQAFVKRYRMPTRRASVTPRRRSTPPTITTPPSRR